MHRETWKKFERFVASAVRGRRIPVTGIGRGDRDVEASYRGGQLLGWFQVKKRKDVRSVLTKWLDEIRELVATEAKGTNIQTPFGALVISAAGESPKDALLVMRLHDFGRLVDALEAAPVVTRIPKGSTIAAPARADFVFTDREGGRVFVRL